MPNCRDCRKPIRFALAGDATIPVDAKPSFEGNFVLFHGEDWALMARPARLPADQMRPRYKHHFDSCPQRRKERR